MPRPRGRRSSQTAGCRPAIRRRSTRRLRAHHRTHQGLIIRGGENIAPKEIEDLLREHPAVADASVYGVASEFFGEEVAAAVRLKAGASTSAEALAAFCESRIARFKVPG